MMIRRNLFLLLAFVLFVGFPSVLISQQSLVAIVLNEYCVSNDGTQSDAFGAAGDWVEIRNAHTSSVSLASYYLSNDRNNLFKWKFPNSFVMQVGEYKAVWLSGRNTIKNGEYHANFTIEQCHNQWLILTTSAGVVRDSVFIQSTKVGQTRGRVNINTMGIPSWRLYTSGSFLFPNPSVNNYVGYCPTPKMVSVPLASLTTAGIASSKQGGFYPGVTPFVYFKLENQLAYTSSVSCFQIYYTVDGTFPIPNAPGTTLYTDSATGTTSDLLLVATTMVRAIAYPTPTVGCAQDYLPSFCETNTYFIDPADNALQSEFGVLSLAMDKNWFLTNGAFSPTIHAEYYDKKLQVSEGYAKINRPVQEAWLTKQRGMYISMDDKLGYGCAFEGQVFNVDLLGTSTRTFFPTLHLKSGDIESSSKTNDPTNINITGTGLRDAFLQSLAAKSNIDVNPLRVKPVITYINGKYWGVFDLREVYDKYYESHYHSQSKDSLTLAFYYNSEGTVSYLDGSSSNFDHDFKTQVYDVVTTYPMNSALFYNQVMSQLDKSSFIDYMIMNSYAMNSDLWNYNVAYAKGGQTNFPGGKWHYYLWNTPTVFNYLTVQTNTLVYNNANISPCELHDATRPAYPALISPLGGNTHPIILNRLMNPINGNKGFQMEYKNRYVDLLNGPLKCENILKYFDQFYALYQKEMVYHSDPATGLEFGTVAQPDPFCWDSNMVKLRKVLENRCYVVANAFNKSTTCYGMVGPFDISVNVKPDSAGSVKLNSIVLPYYPWYGKYYTSSMSFKAIPTSTAYTFDHWELKNPQSALGPLSVDSIGFTFAQPEDVIAVFTNKSNDLASSGENSNVPTGFSPNGDNKNDIFRPLGSANFTKNYEMIIWSRWGEEVFRSLTPLDGWDGNYKGKPAITGVYAYVIKYQNIYGEDLLLKGNVTLTR